ncbi:MAG: hypothetical protein H0T68_09700 [Gemmatimonadales bacterium]|nr:hypothetical protein [Gemmatimonadales bacterium]MBA3556684.1 hypothetical protein [Gemmatimonadales bacterium]
MTSSRALPFLCLGAAILTACGEGTGPSSRVVDCSTVSPTVLAVGEHTIIDAAAVGCVQLPAAGASGAEHLYVALSGQGVEVRDGITAGYELTVTPASAATAGSRIQASRAPVESGATSRFHDRIRSLERELVARTAGARPAPAASRAAAEPPAVGHQRTFKVCETAECDDFVDVAGTARVVGERVAIYLDDAAPAGGYSEEDLLRVGGLFDNYLHPIDTTAFGSESDLDGNEVVVVLLTAQVNNLRPNCNTTGNIVVGYFYGLDLLPDRSNSNGGEVFYGLVPEPDNPTCTTSREEAIVYLPSVFAHEFMHMIGFNQGVLERGARRVEQTWLDEGLAHFAEELAGRQVPDAECQPSFDNCETQFIEENLGNAQLYLEDPEATFLIQPDTSTGELSERGANWLFVRWLADHYAGTQPLGAELTRALVQTTLRGSANVEAFTGESFDDLVARWQLANYLEDLPGFTPADETLQYSSWAFREAYLPYPLEPDSTETGAYSRAGTLRGGSGRHLRIIQPGSAAPVTLRLTRDDGDSALSDDAEPRVALIRIR